MNRFSCLFCLIRFAPVLVASTASSLLGQSFLTDGLVAFYPLNGNAKDASGNGNHGTVTNIVFVADRFGVVGNAAAFAGKSSSMVTIPTTNLNLSRPFTVSAWVKFTNTVSGRILSTAGYELNIDSRHAAINVSGTGNSGTNVQSPATLAAGVWHHVVGVWGNNALQVFTNGVLAGTVSTPITPSYSRGFIPKLGRNSGSAADSFPGLIDDVRVYNRELAAEEVAQLRARSSSVGVGLAKAVRPTFFNLLVGEKYQLQASGGLTIWTNLGPSFIATNSDMAYPNYFDVENWENLFFRVKPAP